MMQARLFQAFASGSRWDLMGSMSFGRIKPMYSPGKVGDLTQRSWPLSPSADADFLVEDTEDSRYHGVLHHTL